VELPPPPPRLPVFIPTFFSCPSSWLYIRWVFLVVTFFKDSLIEPLKWTAFLNDWTTAFSYFNPPPLAVQDSLPGIFFLIGTGARIRISHLSYVRLSFFYRPSPPPVLFPPLVHFPFLLFPEYSLNFENTLFLPPSGPLG